MAGTPRGFAAWTVLLATAVALAAPAAALTPKPKPKPKKRMPPFLTFKVFAETGLPVSDVTWTGQRFIYASETLGTFSASGPAGTPVSSFSSISREVEEVRCRPSPGTHG
jgi:hypothetical protein